MNLKESAAGRDTDIDVRSLFKAALLGGALLVASLIGVTVASDRQNQAAAATESAALQGAIAQETTILADRLVGFAAQTPLPDSVKLGRALPSGTAQVYLIDRDAADPSSGLPAGTRDTLAAALRDMSAGGTWTGSVRDGDVIYLAAAHARSDARNESRRRAADLVALEPVGDAMLARLARTAGTRPLALRAGTATASEDASALHLGADAMVTWIADRPGDLFFRAASIILTICGALFAMAMLFFSRRITHTLVQREASAKADAHHDALTGLANRTAFASALQREVDRTVAGAQGAFALIYLDIDRFKEVNDTYGHGAGDVVIATTAQRIASAVRAGSRVARIGGDEFAIIMSDVKAPQDCAALAQRILTLFAEPIVLSGSKAHVSVSIGIALCPGDAQSMNSVINSADLALYRAKNEGRNRFCFFEGRMGEELRMRRTVEDDLRTAIETNQLVMEYQPIVALDGRKMIGVESLVRWRHPTKGTISPASFITLAEECGLILPLGEWVMRQALSDARRWPGFKVAVNVSAIQFRQKNFVQTVQRLLQETGVEPAQLELELTESVLLADADQAEDAMIDLRAMGVRLALDDFGTGYSSLIYLRRFAFDKIKIDKSFLESTESTGESAIIVHSIVHLGRALGLTVTAEGVETQDQHRFMQALGCHELQGFLFSPPVSAAEIDRRLGVGSALELKSVA